ncbi:MAG: hypothetical protein Q9202_001312, partial [Teloschistes flavicans]
SPMPPPARSQAAARIGLAHCSRMAKHVQEKNKRRAEEIRSLARRPIFWDHIRNVLS